MHVEPDDFCITLSSRKNFLLTGVLTLSLLFWGAGLMVVMSAVLRGQIKEFSFFVVFYLLAWLGGWLLVGGLALYGLLWISFGQETLVATPAQFILTRRIRRYQRVRRYDLVKIRSLRLVEADQGVTDFLLSFRLFGIGNGRLTFDYGATVVTCAEGVDLAQAQHLLDKLRNRLQVGQERCHV